MILNDHWNKYWPTLTSSAAAGKTMKENPKQQLLPFAKTDPAGKEKRSTKLIADFESGFAKGWEMAVGEWFREALDIKLTDRVNNGRKKKVWTQGKAYSFDTGDVVYDSMGGYSAIWSDAIKNINILLQVIDATPAEYKEEEGGKKKLTPGRVRFQVLMPDHQKKGLIKHDVVSCTQAEFVNILKKGTIQDKLIEQSANKR